MVYPRQDVNLEYNVVPMLETQHLTVLRRIIQKNQLDTLFLNCASAIADHPYACFISVDATAISAPHGRVPLYNVHPGSVPITLLKSSHAVSSSDRLNEAMPAK